MTSNHLNAQVDGRDKNRAFRSAPIVLPIVSLVVFTPWLVDIDHMAHALLIAAQLALCATGIAFSFIRGLRPVALIFFTFSFAWLGIGPAYQLSIQKIPWNDQQLLTQPRDVTAALGMTLLATLMFGLGTLIQTRHRKTPARTDPVEVNLSFTWIFILGALALSPFAIQAAGGVSGLFTNRGDRSNALAEAGISVAESGGVQLALAKILPAALAIAASYTSTLRLRKSWHERGFWGIHGREAAAFSASVALLILYCNPLVSSRFLAILAFGPLIMAAIQPRSITAAKLFAIAAMAGTAIIYPLANIFRMGFDARTSYKTGLDAFAGMDFDGFQQVANSLIYVREIGHTLGHYTTSALAFFVPRSWWEGKATPASIDVAGNRGYAFTNLSLPLHAELYIEFGLIGMAICMVAFGWLCASSDSSWLLGPATRLGILAPMLSMAMLGLLRGPLGSLAPVYLTALGLTFLALSRRKPPEHPVPRSSDSSQEMSSPPAVDAQPTATPLL